MAHGLPIFVAVRRFFFIVFVVAAVLAVLAVAGGSLPAGNPLHDATEGLRSLGSNLGDGFGGGYQPVTGG
jgi:hypothetical protein